MIRWPQLHALCLAACLLNMSLIRPATAAAQVSGAAESEEEVEPTYGDFDYLDVLKNVVEELKERREVREGLRRYSYVTKVGGIAFDGEAVPMGTSPSAVKLSYDPAARDGERFLVLLDGEEAVLPGYDWKLIPILRFAASPYYSCFSLFGTSGDQSQDESLKARHGLKYLCSYHPAFKNTLVGLRLMQMDAFMTDLNSFHQLPHDGAGREILGADEHYDPSNERHTYDQKQALIDLIEGFPSYTAYIITGSKQGVRFNVAEGRIRLMGELHVHFWTTASDFPGVQDRIQREVAARLGVTLLPDGRITSTNRKSLDDFQKESEERIDRALVVGLDPLSDAVSRDPNLIRRINPIVYDATRDVMRYGAFFRFCRARDSAGFDRLAGSLKNRLLAPRVRTPNCVRD